MNKTELLALAECLFDQDEDIPADEPTPSRDAAAILRKLAALEPVAWRFDAMQGRECPPHWFFNRNKSTNGVFYEEPIYNLTGIIDHE